MTAWVILFRGVGGATKLPVGELRPALEAAGFGQVATYVASGNAVLSSPLPREGVVASVKAAVAPMGFGKEVHALSREEWAGAIARNPFPPDPGTALHAAVLAAPPDPARVAALQAAAAGREGFEVRGLVAYVYTPDGFGRSALAARFDRGVGVANTARNWNTVTRLMAMLEGVDA